MRGQEASKACIWRLDSNAVLLPSTTQERSDARRKYNELATAEGLLGSIRLRLLGREITLSEKGSGSKTRTDSADKDDDDLFPLPLPSPFSLLLRPPVFIEATDVDANGCETRPVCEESVVYKALHDLCERDWKASMTESGEGTETIFMQQEEDGDEEDTVGNRFMGNRDCSAKQDLSCGGGLGLLDELTKDGMVLLGEEDDEEAEDEEEEEEDDEEEEEDSDVDEAEEDTPLETRGSRR